MEILDNWIIQVILGNIIWVIFCKVLKYFKNYLDDLDKHNSSKKTNALYPKKILEKQFNICFKISSISTISILVILFNNLQNKLPFLSISLMIGIFLCQILILGAFEGALKHFDE